MLPNEELPRTLVRMKTTTFLGKGSDEIIERDFIQQSEDLDLETSALE